MAELPKCFIKRRLRSSRVTGLHVQIFDEKGREKEKKKATVALESSAKDNGAERYSCSSFYRPLNRALYLDMNVLNQPAQITSCTTEPCFYRGGDDGGKGSEEDVAAGGAAVEILSSDH